MASDAETLKRVVAQYRDRYLQFGAREAAGALNRVLALMEEQEHHAGPQDQ